MSLPVNTIAAGINYLDLEFQGRPNVIASALLVGPGGVTLIDPGPASCLPALETGLARQGARLDDIEALLLTHIHLDHAGASGTLVQRNDRIRVYVHETGARHLVDPSRLLESARRLYGSEMDRLWGDVLPVSQDRVYILSGGERIGAAGRDLDVKYTPGHASHHVSFFDRSSGVAFVGDTAGIRIAGSSYVLPPTPPPDIDLELWRASIEAIEAWSPDTLFLAHFGPATAVRPHLQELQEQLMAVAEMVRRSLGVPGTDEDRFRTFVGEFGHHLRRRLSEDEAATYERAAPLRYNWQGLARYWKKRAGG